MITLHMLAAHNCDVQVLHFSPGFEAAKEFRRAGGPGPEAEWEKQAKGRSSVCYSLVRIVCRSTLTMMSDPETAWSVVEVGRSSCRSLLLKLPESERVIENQAPPKPVESMHTKYGSWALLSSQSTLYMYDIPHSLIDIASLCICTAGDWRLGRTLKPCSATRTCCRSLRRTCLS